VCGWGFGKTAGQSVSKSVSQIISSASTASDPATGPRRPSKQSRGGPGTRNPQDPGAHTHTLFQSCLSYPVRADDAVHEEQDGAAEGRDLGVGVQLVDAEPAREEELRHLVHQACWVMGALQRGKGGHAVSPPVSHSFTFRPFVHQLVIIVGRGYTPRHTTTHLEKPGRRSHTTQPAPSTHIPRQSNKHAPTTQNSLSPFLSLFLSFSHPGGSRPPR
jgi:hypothetical protein